MNYSIQLHLPLNRYYIVLDMYLIELIKWAKEMEAGLITELSPKGKDLYRELITILK